MNVNVSYLMALCLFVCSSGMAGEDASEKARKLTEEFSKKFPQTGPSIAPVELEKGGEITEEGAIAIAQFKLDHAKKKLSVKYPTRVASVEVQGNVYVIRFASAEEDSATPSASETVTVDRKTGAVRLEGEDLKGYYENKVKTEIAALDSANAGAVITASRAVEIAREWMKDELKKHPRECTGIVRRNGRYYVYFSDISGKPMTIYTDELAVLVGEQGERIRIESGAE